MKHLLSSTLIVLALVVAMQADSAFGQGRRPVGAWRGGVAPMGSWHAGYYDPAWGMPIALVVPPKAEMETNWGWGVGNTRITPLYWQFYRNYPGPLFYDQRTFLPIPPWPSDTSQFGVYSVRGPW